ncbi:MAG: hypothetical protein AAGA92_02930 [Planctomycetota bacterium]
MPGEQSDWDKFVKFTQDHSALIGVGGTIASGILSAYLAEREAERQAQLAKEVIDTVVTRIAQAEDRIIDHLEQLQLRELEGKILGIKTLLSEFDGQQDERFLGDIIVESALVLGRLEVKMRSWEERRSESLEAYALFALMFPVRIQAFAERKRVFQINDDQDILNRLRDCLELLDQMELALRSLNDDQCRLDSLPLPAGTAGFATKCVCQGVERGTSTLFEPVVAETACSRFKEDNWPVLAKSHLEFRGQINQLAVGYSQL